MKSKKQTGKHFLLKPESRTITSDDIDAMSDTEFNNFIMELRWGVEGKQGCPRCGVLDEHYYLATRKVYKCKHCEKQFSLTSGSAFHSAKKNLRTIIKIMLKFILNVKGISAIAISREFDISYKSAYTWLHKFRTMAKTSCLKDYERNLNQDSPLHLDGTYVHTNIRKANKKEDRKDARLVKNANKNKRCLFIIAKNHNEEDEQLGSKVILPFIIASETNNVVNKIVKEWVKKGSTICADESHAYDELLIHHNLYRVNHSEEYCSDFGITNNQAESFFSRFKRGFKGQYHKMSNKYLDLYSYEFAFRENKRRLSSFSTLLELLYYGLQETGRNVMRGYNHKTSTKQEVLYV